MFKFEYLKTERGAIALLLSMIIISVIFVISVGMAITRITEIKLASNVSDSTIAYQAADSGIEYALNQVQANPSGSTIDGYSICPNKQLAGSGKYCLELSYTDGNVSYVKSIGEYKNTKRAVEVTFAEEGEVISSDPSTHLLVHADGFDGAIDFTDSSLYQHSVSAVGNAQMDIDYYKFGGASAFFYNLGDYLTVSDSESWYFGSGDFTIDFWFRAEVLPFGGGEIVFWEQEQTNGINEIIFSWNSDVGRFKFYVFNNTDGNWGTGSGDWNWTPSLNQWYHIALVKNDNKLMLFIDGNKLGGNITIQQSVSVTSFYNAFSSGNCTSYCSSRGGSCVEQEPWSSGVCPYYPNGWNRGGADGANAPWCHTYKNEWGNPSNNTRCGGGLTAGVSDRNVICGCSVTSSMTISVPDFNAMPRIGLSQSSGRAYIDEFRVSKGISRWTSNFSPPTEPY